MVVLSITLMIDLMKISVIIPTYNEYPQLERLIRHLHQHGGEHLTEIIVTDGGSTDATLQRAAELGAVAVLSPGKGRAAQMNYGAQQASGDVLYFVHADVTVPPSFVSDIAEALAQGYQFGCYRFQFNSPRAILRFNAYFTRLNVLAFRGGDQTLFMPRSFFEQLNGFDEYYVIMEDYDILRRAARIGKFKLIQKDVIVSARKYTTNSWLRVQIANITATLMFRLGANPKYIARTYKQMLNYR